MGDLFLPIMLTLLIVSQLIDIPATLGDQRKPPRLRGLDIAAHLLFSLFLAAVALDVYEPTRIFITRYVSASVYLAGCAALLAGWFLTKAAALSIKRKIGPQADEAPLSEQVVYTDVTGDPAAAAAANRPEAMVHALERLGFRSVCLLRTSTKPGVEPPVTEVNELFTSPDGRAFAEPETFFARDAIALRTLLSDGTIIDTTLLVDHGPGGNFFGRWLVRIRWPRSNRPGASYFFQRLEDTSAEKLWALHQERVDRIIAQRAPKNSGVHIMPHTTFQAYIDLSRRAFQINADGKLLDLLSLGIGVPLALLLPFPLVWLTGLRSSIAGAVLYLVLGPVLLIALPFAVLRLTRYLPVPALRMISGVGEAIDRFIK